MFIGLRQQENFMVFGSSLAEGAVSLEIRGSRSLIIILKATAIFFLCDWFMSC